MACLHVLACGGMPPQLYREDLIECILGHLKACLLSNVLPFHDARVCRAHRPQLLDAGKTLLDAGKDPVFKGPQRIRGCQQMFEGWELGIHRLLLVPHKLPRCRMFY